MELKKVLFESARKALDDYMYADHALDMHIGLNGLDGMKKIRDARYQRFCGIWSVIEAAQLVDEYEKWTAGAKGED